METAIQEIRREKVFIPQNMTVRKIQEKYEISKSSASNTQKRGWFIKNYARNQVIIDREHFQPLLAYSIANKVFFKNFSRNPIAVNIKTDLIQEAVSLMFQQSGKIKEDATEKYSSWYGYWWCAHNAMLSYIKKWINKTQCECELQDEIHPMMFHGNMSCRSCCPYLRICDRTY
jgi:hypothetical protein